MVRSRADILLCFAGLSRPEPAYFVSTLHRLISLTNEELSTIDVGFVNLLIGGGLPGKKNMTFGKYFQTMDEWAQIVAEETESWRPNFRPNPSCPTDAQYRCFKLAQTLRDRFNLKHYLMPDKGTGFVGCRMTDPHGNPARFDDSKLLFIHGLLSEDRIGSCSSLPVLFTAVGRRLGYPLKLVLAVNHLFFRWEDENEVFNVEATGPDCISCDPDEYFVDKPRPWTEEEKTCGALLSSLTPRQELASFLHMRFGCLKAHERWYECRAILRAVCILHPENPHYTYNLEVMEAKVAYEVNRNPPIQPTPFNNPVLPEFHVPLHQRRFVWS